MIYVRRAETKDAADIIRICSSGWRVTYHNLYPSTYIEAVIREFYSKEKVIHDISENSRYFHGYWVAEKDGKVLGCICGGIDDSNTGHVYAFYVLPEYKRQGVGQALLDRFTQYQQEQYHIKEQWITSLTEGNEVGLGFYQKQGFEIIYSSENSHPDISRLSLHLRRFL